MQRYRTVHLEQIEHPSVNTRMQIPRTQENSSDFGSCGEKHP